MVGAVAGAQETRDAFLGELVAWAEGEDGLRMLWLQGSLAAGGADPWSDVDAYVAVADGDLDSMFGEREGHLHALGGALAWSEATGVPRALHALMAGGVRLDLFYEGVSRLGQTLRPSVKVLVDKDGLAAQLQRGSPVDAGVVGRIIRVIVRMTRQGSTWPLRLLGRGEWSTLAMLELDLINAQLAQLMAVSRDAANFYVNPFALKAKLGDEERAELDRLTTAALAAAVDRDIAALKAVHLQWFDAFGREGRRACQALGAAYPVSEADEAAIRALIEARWPL